VQPPTVHGTCGEKRKESHDESESDEDIVGNREEKQGEVARMDGVQSPVRWFCSLQTLNITLFGEKSWKRRRRREKLPGWSGYNIQSSGLILSNPCTLHYCIKSLGQGGEAVRSCQGGWGTTSSQVVSFLANPVHYIIM
jgi:hypothetical protein